MKNLISAQLTVANIARVTFRRAVLMRMLTSLVESRVLGDTKGRETMKTNDFLGHEWDIDCMGCAISECSMIPPGGIIRKTQYFCVHQDPLIPLPGFLVIATVRHIRSLSEMQATEYEEFSGLLRTTQQAIKNTIDLEYLTLIQEENSVHFHLWFFPWSQSVMERYGSPSLTKIREIMTEFRKYPIGEKEWRELGASIEKIRAQTG